ncbi:hypothetical protein QE357_003806 [Siphonobacter sp. BAB-5404]|nr:hypothetical protein [Siphonobacter sp. SORGH_AS_1065]MDR6196754.1 hypothetical protein [Siphonobacter sp. SORGH_AS_0500]
MEKVAIWWFQLIFQQKKAEKPLESQTKFVAIDLFGL